MIIAAATVITVVTVIVLISCYKATVTFMEKNEFYLKDHKNNDK